MFFRIKKLSSGNVLQLIKSYRNEENQPRQQILLSLGSTPIPEALQPAIAKELERRLDGIEFCFEQPQEVLRWADLLLQQIQRKGIAAPNPTPQEDAILVNPTQLSHEHTTSLGPLLAVQAAWKALDMNRILKECGFNDKQICLAGISIWNRLLEPCSEHALPAWIPTTSLEELWQKQVDRFTEGQFYRISDLLLDHQEKIEESLRQRELELFQLQNTYLLYDLTNTYFEGEAAKNPKAKRGGHSKEKRNDAPQLAMGLVLDNRGFVLKHKTFAGNTSDSATLVKMLEELGCGDTQNPTVVIDSGIASQENLDWIRSKKWHYMAVGKRPCRDQYKKAFEEGVFCKIRKDLEISFVDQEDERIVLCQSSGRKLKEKGILSHAEKRLLDDLEKAKKSFAKRVSSDAAMNQRIGRVLGRHPRAARYYKVTLSGRELSWSPKETMKAAEENHGRYVIRSSRKELSGNEIWKTYMTLSRIEAGFRQLKSDLGLRPIYHQLEERCDAHVFITVLAYHLLHWIEERSGESWESMHLKLRTHAYTTIICPAVDGRVLHLRTPGRPDSQQKTIYQTLDISLKSLPRRETWA